MKRGGLVFIAGGLASFYCKIGEYLRGFEFSRLDDARSGSALTVSLRLGHTWVLTAVQGCHSLPSPFESLFAKKEKSAESALFLFGLPWGIRTPNRQNRNLILYPIALRADEIPCGILSFF